MKGIKEMEKEKNEYIGFFIPKPLKDKFCTFLEENSFTMSKFLRNAIKKEMETKCGGKKK